MKIVRWLPPFAILAGLGAMLLRRWQLDDAFEPYSGLAITWHPANISLLVLSLAVIAALAAACARWKAPVPGSRTAAFGTSHWRSPAGQACITLQVASGAILLAAGGTGLYQFFTGTEARTSRMIFYFFAIVSSLCILITVQRANRGKREGDPDTLPTLIPAFFACLWLVLIYQQHAANPVLPYYVFELLAVISLLLGLYSIAGPSFGQARPRRIVFFCLLGVYFSLISFADLSAFERLPLLFLYLSGALYTGTMACALIHNARVGPPPPVIGRAISSDAPPLSGGEITPPGV